MSAAPSPGTPPPPPGRPPAATPRPAAPELAASGPAAAPRALPAPSVSIVVPVYDEERVLPRSLDAIAAALEELGRTFEIVCVDDGSRDGSAAVLHERAERDTRVRALGHERNLGKGAAVRTGVLAARGELVLFLDADLSTPLDELPRFLGALEAGSDVVIGNRRAPGARIVRRQPFLRETLGKGFTVLTRLFLAPGVHDFTCGFKGFRAEAARAIFSRSTLDGWAFDAEIVVIADVHGFRLAQLPVAWHHEDDTKVRVGRAVLESLRDVLRVRWRRLRGRYR